MKGIKKRKGGGLERVIPLHKEAVIGGEGIKKVEGKMLGRNGHPREIFRLGEFLCHF